MRGRDINIQKIIKKLDNHISLSREYGGYDYRATDVYPIFHGGYISNWYGDGVQEEYMYWHLGNIELMDMDLYLNDDILFTYLSQIQHNPLFYEQLPLNNNILVKIDSKNGATIWAKEIFDYSFSVNFEINKSFLINDITWSLLFSLLSGMNTIFLNN